MSLEQQYTEILGQLGEDVSREGLLDTPKRAAKAMQYLCKGYQQTLEEVTNGALFSSDNSEMVLVKNIELYSLCEHHLLPFTGVAHVAYLPDERLVGLGSIVRAVETLASRPQLQERLGDDIVAALDAALAPLGTLVVIDARHGCVTSRGSRQADSTTVTVAASGALADPVRRAEVMVSPVRAVDTITASVMVSPGCVQAVRNGAFKKPRNRARPPRTGAWVSW